MNHKWRKADKELRNLIDKATTLATERVIEDIKDYQHGFVRDDGTGEPERAPEWQVIEDLITALAILDKEEGVLNNLTNQDDE